MDVGTNNHDYLNSSHYMGVKKPRLKGAEYEAFVDRFVKIVKKTLPHVLLQWEDFAKDNARHLLKNTKMRSSPLMMTSRGLRV